MQPNLYSPPLSDNLVDGFTTKDGLIENVPLLSLDLPDAYIIQNLHGRVQNSLDYYNEGAGFNLKNKRSKNMRMIRGDQIEENALYHYQTPYKDNELFVGVDAMIAYAVSAVASPEVYPATKDKKSRILADDLLSYMKAHSQKFELDAELETVVLNLLAQYVGIIKLEWNPNWGPKGEIIPRAVNPSRIIVDKNARRGGNPSFICEVMKDSVEGLISKFPKKEQEILKLFNIKRKGTQNISKELAYREVWFTYYDKKYKQQEGVCWYINDLVLDKRKSPNWLYKGEGENFLDNPAKPYIPFNLFNDGDHWIDFTGSVEQAVSMQDVVNKEGRQKVDNLSTANGFRMVAAGALNDDAIENLTGDPNQTIVIKLKPGQKLDDVYKQIEPHLVSEQLIADANNGRDVIHSILGTPSQFRGDDSDQTKTASEAQMIKNQASGRQDKVVRALNRGLGHYYRYLTQMIAVWYDDSHALTAESGDGGFDYLEMHQNKIEPGMTVRVYAEPSSDKARQEAVAQNAAELGVIAPIDYYKMMHMQNPQRLYDNFLKFKGNPQQLAMDIANDDEDRDAITDFADLMDGKKVAQREDITPEYLDQFRKEMITDRFLDPKLKTTIRNNIIDFAKRATILLAVRTELDEASNAPLPAPPLPPEIQATMPAPAPPAPQAPGMPGQAPPAPNPGMPPQGPPMPQQPVSPAPTAPPQAVTGSPLPAVGMPPMGGIQGALQTANQATSPNLNPMAQPSPGFDITSLTPR